jgi:hypothetical protein
MSTPMMASVIFSRFLVRGESTLEIVFRIGLYVPHQTAGSPSPNGGVAQVRK